MSSEKSSEKKVAKKPREQITSSAKKYLKEQSEEVKYYLELTKKSLAFKHCLPRQRLFVINYILCNGNAGRAALMSGCESKYYYVVAAKWMKEPKIQKAIQEFWEIVFGDKITKIERQMIDTLYRRAFTNRLKYFNEDGTMKDGITEETMGEDHVIIDGMERKYYGKDADVSVVVYKLADRDSALKQLQSLLGLGQRNINITTNNEQKTGVLYAPPEATEAEWEES